jgi:hypothetical protein
MPYQIVLLFTLCSPIMLVCFSATWSRMLTKGMIDE